MKTVDVVIVGAGPVGASLACLLAGAGISTAIIDQAPLAPMEHPDFDGRAYAIAAGPRRVLEQAGLWDLLPLEPCPIEQIRVSDGQVGRPASRLFLHFDHRDVGDDPVGWMVEARSLRVALNARLNAMPGLDVYAPARAQVERSPEGAIVRVAGGPVIACRLVIAADGRQSTLRSEAGISVTRIPYHQSGIVCAVAHEKPHHNTALEHFLPSGPFAQLPLRGTAEAENVSALVWTERTALAERLFRLEDAAFAREIGRRMGDHLGWVRPIGRRWLYPLSALYAQRYVDTRLALIGDAAHGVHPIAGQGLNLGFRDIEVLAELLREAVAAGGDPGDPALLARYQRQRRPDNMLMLVATDALDRLFSTNNPVLRLARDLGIAGVHRMPGLKRRFMREAMGAGSGGA
jgi:2-octaprenyl-6-methoxyphenol hydroxylase